MEQYLLHPVSKQHGKAEVLPLSAIEAVEYPECYVQTHCVETTKEEDQKTQKVSSSSGGSSSKDPERRTGAPASKLKPKASRAPQDNRYCPQYSLGDHPPPYDAVMTENDYRYPLHDRVNADKKLLDTEDDDGDENALENDAQGLKHWI